VEEGGNQVTFASKSRLEGEWDLSIVDVSDYKSKIQFLVKFLIVLLTKSE